MVNPTQKRIGIIGGGQLAWMLGLAARDVGITVVVQTPNATDSAVTIADEVIYAPIDDLAATQALGQKVDVITFENEFVDLVGLQRLADTGVCFRPSLSSLTPLLDKLDQRQFLASLGLPVPKFVGADHVSTIAGLTQKFQFPVVIKARRHGYDGQGTFVIKDAGAWDVFWQAHPDFKPFLVEAFVPFRCELGMMAARSTSGEIALHPLVETQQENQVCRRVIAPAKASLEMITQAQAMAATLLEALDFVGILGIEFFLTDADQLLINEIAPRTHNSGHYTIEACHTSQFAQHLLAITGRGLGNPGLQSPAAVMINLLGFETATSDYGEKRQTLSQIPQATVHWYGKTQAYPGRKLGHVTVLLHNQEPETMTKTLSQIESIWYS
ncbi:5-(carboxyamino)imidazole ribonucleotide synthase [Thermosynechococcaceae cyanobacterium BACA0444]|uniref:N5-carboxyaminoimidazole ribonucleotide synthase n=1 Tax=Pseudocalidococcus azoricus BACA0444 TaxID=2918990 RepID=A0AAE4JXE3_9CYAN|nr:5-(carboxyamino)imidazole ribonucleotide synthase [Pseudocalidococcus azoricus]MDS3862440.1 5-(carboxyamino)imidazole ribonucleotide synthase [Pseudocalidococcus azoricus BACA0444]